ncbi:MAG TPA: TVP38/TMEM64 family protein [Hyphomonas atlantica]|nr:TVP38/TMEM64 family protein [Hyphomonas atlantica]
MDTQPAPKKVLDANARRGAIIGGGALLVILVLFLIGKTTNLTDLEALQTTMESIAASPWALPALIVLFVVGAFVGIPQFALLAISIAMFGPWLGAFMGWIANMVAGATTFYAGRLAGEKTFRRYAGETANKLSGFVGRNALMTSAIVRNVPAGPALLVNMAFGVSHAKFLHYWAGMGVGIIPKIALIAFAGQSLFAAFKGNPLVAIAAAGAAIAVYIAIAAYARARMRKAGQSVALIPQNEVDSAAP